MRISNFQINVNTRGGVLIEFGIHKGNIIYYT